jgi:hypothetical protein
VALYFYLLSRPSRPVTGELYFLHIKWPTKECLKEMKKNRFLKNFHFISGKRENKMTGKGN